MRTAAEWDIEVERRRRRLQVTRQPWLRELLVRMVVAAEQQLQRALEVG